MMSVTDGYRWLQIKEEKGMNFTVNGNIFKKMVKNGRDLQKNVNKYQHFQDGVLITGNEKTRSVTLTMGDGNNQLKMIDNRASVGESGSVLLNAEAIKIIDALDFKKNGMFTINDNFITHGKKTIQVMSAPVEEFTQVNEDINIPLFTVTEETLLRLLEVSKTTDVKNTSRYATGINISKNRFAATNIFCLSIRDTDEFEIMESILLSETLWRMLLKIVPKSGSLVQVFWDGDKLIKFVLGNGDIVLIGRLIDDTFLNIDAFIEGVKANTTATVNVDNVLSSLKVMDKMSVIGNVLQMDVTEEGLALTVESPFNRVHDIIIIKDFTGVPITIWVNIKQVITILSQYKKQDITLKFTRSNKPIIFEGDGYYELFMPMRKPD